MTVEAYQMTMFFNTVGEAGEQVEHEVDLIMRAESPLLAQRYASDKYAGPGKLCAAFSWPKLVEMKPGDVAQIKHEAETVVITKVWEGLGHVSALRNGREQYIPTHLLEVISEVS